LNYSTYKSLWTHNKIHHNGLKTVRNNTIDEPDAIGLFACRKCGSKYKHRQSRHNHEKQCIDNGNRNQLVEQKTPEPNDVIVDVENQKLDKENQKLDKENQKLDKENQKLDKENLKLDKEKEKLDKEKEILELKLKLVQENKKEFHEEYYINMKIKNLCIHDKQMELCRSCEGSALCVSPLCDSPANKKYDNHCLRCHMHLFPNARNYKTKEKAVTDFILQSFPSFSWVTDKKVQDGCSRRRPDLCLDLGFQIIIVEIDENQHQTYDTTCEHKRLMEISRDVNHRPVVFIRFNPDDYINKEKIRIRSSWKPNRSGILLIQEELRDEWQHRLNRLKLHIEYWSNEINMTDKTVETVHLFFDE
jgi:hypothetical protein